MNIGEAIKLSKEGKKIARAGWNGKDMWLVYMSGMTLPPFSTQGTARKVNQDLLYSLCTRSVRKYPLRKIAF